MSPTTRAPRTPLLCRDPREYLAAALDLEALEAACGHALIPVAGSEGQLAADRATLSPGAGVRYEGSSSLDLLASPGWLAARLREIHEERRRAGGSACVVWAHDALCTAGIVHAIVEDKSLIIAEADDDLEHLGDLLGARTSVVLTMSPAALERISCDRLAHAMRATRTRWGILTGTDVAGASRLVARSHARRPPQLPRGLVYQLGREAPIKLDDLDETVLPNHPAPDRLTRILGGEPFVIFSGHGRSYCAMDGNLCSRLDAAAAGDRACFAGFDCMFPNEPRVPAGALRGDVLVLEQCATAAFRLNYPQPAGGANLALQLLNGAASAVISPYRIHHPTAFASYLSWEHCLRGATMGELCHALGRLAEQKTGMPSPYILLGDPDLRICAPESVAEVPRHTGALGGHVRLAITPGRICRHRVAIDGLTAAERLHGLVDDALIDRLAIEVIRHEDRPSEVDLVIACDRGVSAAEVDVTLTSRDPLRPDLVEIIDQTGRALREARACFDGGFEDRSLDALDRLLAEVGPKLVMAHDADFTSASLHAAVEEAQQILIGACAAAQASMIEIVVRRAEEHVQWLENHYRAARGMRRSGVRWLSTPCPYCGSRLVARRYRAGLWPSERRETVECERCLVIADLPEERSLLTIDCAETVTGGELIHLRLRARNDLPVTALIHCGVALDRKGSDLDRFTVEPPPRHVILAPGKELDVAFIARPGPGVRSNAINVHGVMLSNGALCSALRRINIVRRDPQP
ncbi:hypothetical protein [Polyangium mundeleinium]|uniref:Uncharacterized protein n=1 Tax=Polyangium mundeleinium TaxID=2995306 RepID=A0ABT5EMA8_9BACT|nr:hypothetical protein [Polyangium mundeleinium]MDC0742936.1 hypothetical protein [Polyangium mundeleinium]